MNASAIAEEVRFLLEGQEVVRGAEPTTSQKNPATREAIARALYEHEHAQLSVRWNWARDLPHANPALRRVFLRKADAVLKLLPSSSP